MKKENKEIGRPIKGENPINKRLSPMISKEEMKEIDNC